MVCTTDVWHLLRPACVEKAAYGTSGLGLLQVQLALLLPSAVLCCAAGTTCTTWVQVDGTPGTVRLNTVMQELMHNTGLYHSERYACSCWNQRHARKAQQCSAVPN